MDHRGSLPRRSTDGPRTEIPTRIAEALTRAYGSLESPTFHFVREALREQPHGELLAHLAGLVGSARAFEDTEPNDDVSFGLVWEADGGRRVLRLSMVGPFAMLLRLDPGRGTIVVDRGAAPTPLETQIMGQLDADGIELLDRATLELPVPLVLSKTPRHECRVYQALFVDSDHLPWT